MAATTACKSWTAVVVLPDNTIGARDCSTRSGDLYTHAVVVRDTATDRWGAYSFHTSEALARMLAAKVKNPRFNGVQVLPVQVVNASKAKAVKDAQQAVNVAKAKATGADAVPVPNAGELARADRVDARKASGQRPRTTGGGKSGDPRADRAQAAKKTAKAAPAKPATDGPSQTCTGACSRSLPLTKFPTTGKKDGSGAPVRGTECRECRDSRLAKGERRPRTPRAATAGQVRGAERAERLQARLSGKPAPATV